MASEYKALHPNYFANERVRQLRGVQHPIVHYSITGWQVCGSSGSGIYPISTACFDWCDELAAIHDQLGRDDREVAVLLNKPMSELTEEDKKLKRGILTRDFPDLIEYDPVEDMIFSKLAYDYSTILYAETAKARLEAIHRDFVKVGYKTPERWWGELMFINRKCITAALNEINPQDKSFQAINKTFEKLKIFEEKFISSLNPSENKKNIPTVEKLKVSHPDLFSK